MAHPPVGGQPAVRRRHPAHLRRRHRPRRLSTSWSTSGSGGDRPPINDTVDRLPDRRRRQRPAAVDLPALRQRLLGGHHRAGRLHRRPLRLERVAHRARTRGRASTTSATAPARACPATASATPWSAATTSAPSTRPTARRWSGTRGSNSFEGNKAMEATPRGLFAGGDGSTQGGYNVGRIAFYDFNTVPAGNGDRDRDHRPDRGPRRAGPASSSRSRARRTATSGSQPGPGRDHGPQHQAATSQDDLTTWGTTPTRSTPRWPPRTRRRPTWSLPLTITGNRELQLRGQDRRRQRHQRRHQGDQEDRDVRPRPTSRRPPASPGPAAAC